MNRRDFFKNITVFGASAALVPTSVLFAERAKEISQEVIEYSSEKINNLNEYAMGAIIPSITSLALYAYTLELFYLSLFIFLLITSGIVVW